MVRTFALVTALAVALTAGAADAAAQKCRDAKGKFIKCPPPAAAAKCRDKDHQEVRQVLGPEHRACPGEKTLTCNDARPIEGRVTPRQVGRRGASTRSGREL